MKKLKIFVVIFIFIYPVHVMAQSYIWAAGAGGYREESGESVAADAYGNVYVIGNFYSPTVTFGAYPLTNPAPPFSCDIFIVKYDSLGNVLWARSGTGIDIDIGTGITVSADGFIYITGYFGGTQITFGSFTLVNTDQCDMFLVKYDSSGNVIWANSSVGNYVQSSSLSGDGSGNIYITGYFAGDSATFGGHTVINSETINGDIFIAKYDSAGNALWAKNPYGSGQEKSNSIATDAFGNFYITGCFCDTIIFGSITLISGANLGSCNILVAKYDSSGNALWAKSSAGNDSDNGFGICTDASGNVYSTGMYRSSSITFDTITLNNVSPLLWEFYIVKMDSMGNTLWAKRAIGTNEDVGYGVVADTSGNVYVTGYFNSCQISFDNLILISGCKDNTFIVKYNSSGTALWAINPGGTSFHQGHAIAANNMEGSNYVTGYFNSFPLLLGSITLSNSGLFDFYVTKVSGVLTDVSQISKQPEKFEIYPNPNNGTFYLVTNNIIQPETIKASFYNPSGKIIFEKEVNGNDLIQISNADAGIYFLRITSENYTLMKKCLIVK